MTSLANLESSRAEREARLVSRLRTLFVYARDHKRARFENWQRNYRLVHNRLNLPSVSAWMPGPRESLIYPTLSSLIAWMTDQSPAVDIIPAADPTSSFYPFVRQTAEDLSTVLMSTFVADSWSRQVKLALWDAATYGVGWFKSVWDGSKADGYGNASLIRVDPYSLYPDPKATSELDWEFVVEAREMSIEAIERAFPDALIDFDSLMSLSGSGDVLDVRPQIDVDMGSSPKTGPGVIVPASGTYGSLGASAHNYLAARKARPTESAPTKRLRVYEFWMRENNESFRENQDGEYGDRIISDSWRTVVVCAGQILMDEHAPDFYAPGSHPYSRYTMDDVGEMYGISLVDHIAHPQLYRNRLLASVQHNVELTGNPVLVEWENSGSGRTHITNRPGSRIPLKGTAANAPQWLTPPAPPAIAMQLADMWRQSVENTSGLSDLQKGKAPNQRNAQGSLNMVQEAAFVRIRSALSNLEETLRDAMYKCADLIIDNFDEPRIMAIAGPEAAQSSLALAGHHFLVPTRHGATPLRYQLLVEAGSTTATSRDARVAQAEHYAALGLVDDLYVLQVGRVRNPEKVLERLYKKRQAGLMGGGAGQRQRAARSGS